MGDFRKLVVWKKAILVAKNTYDITSKFPKEEIFGLSSQMRRSSVSISSNIAEGNDRNSSGDFKRFLQIALGSCAELETQLEISFLLGYIDAEIKENTNQGIEEVRKMISGLIGKLKT